MKVLIGVEDAKSSEAATVRALTAQFPPESTEVQLCTQCPCLLYFIPPEMAAGYVPSELHDEDHSRQKTW